MVRRPSPAAYVAQWVFLLVVIAVGGLLITTLGANLARRNMHFGFGFLVQRAGFDIPFHLIDWTIIRHLREGAACQPAEHPSGVGHEHRRGNAVRPARRHHAPVGQLAGPQPCALPSSNSCATRRNSSRSVFWYFAVLQTLPPPRQSIPIPGGFLLNIRGLFVPDVIMREGASLLPWLACLALVATPFVWRLRLKERRLGAFALGLPVAALVLLVVGIDRVEVPVLKGFNIAGGVQVPPELVALWAGLSIYATAFIAEIVRSSIEAVSKGQHEAARSLGLRPAHVLFLIVLPQALRIMVPQLTSQYLNLIKSSTLGAVVAYPDIFQIFAGTVMNQSGKEVETIIIVMAVFLTINLLFSAFMNWYNRRVALVER